MTTNLMRTLAGALLLATAACSSHEAAVARGQAAMISLSFTVDAVDVPHRTVTLKDSGGSAGTFTVGEEVKRLSEIKAGDTLVVQYHVGVLAELREPNAEEKAAPIHVYEGLSRAPSSVPPTGALTRSVRVVTTIDALDKTAQTVTLKGPRQGTLTAKVEDTALFPTLKVGQPVVATFAEQLVLAIEPAPQK